MTLPYTMTETEARALVPTDHPHSQLVASALREVARVMRWTSDELRVAQRYNDHLDHLQALMKAREVAPRGTPAEQEVKRAYHRQLDTTQTYARRHRLHFSPQLANTPRAERELTHY